LTPTFAAVPPGRVNREDTVKANITGYALRTTMPRMVNSVVLRLRQWSDSDRGDYGGSVRESDEFPTDLHCEDCGGLVVSGLEPFAPSEDPTSEAEGLTAARSEWCTNLDCPSNHVLGGLTRVGVNDYICTVCNEALRIPMSAVRAHRATH
jgi:hypothetical protein